MGSGDRVAWGANRLIAVTTLMLKFAIVADVTAATAPQGPSVILDATAVPPTGKTIAVAAGGDLQGALNSAQPGDVVELAAGATFTGNFIAPAKPGADAAHWVLVRTSSYASLPAGGNRVSPSNAASMAKIQSNNTGAALTFADAAKFYRLQGLEITTTWSSTSATNYSLIFMGVSPAGLNITSVTQLPSDVVFDRCYIHGTPTGNVRRGITMNSARTAVVDSYISDIHEVGADSQAIGSWNGPGPFKIVNNYLEGAGENVMFGGDNPSITDLVASDIEIRNNLFSKKLSWKSGDPSYAGIAWTVKNLLEFKNARRVLVDGNAFEHSWVHAQSGFAVVLTPRNPGTSPWSAVQDIAFTNNIVRQSAAGINILGTDYNNPSQRTDRVLIRNNLFYDIDGGAWGGGNGGFLQILDGVNNLVVRHNTAIQTGWIIGADGSPATSAFEYVDNLSPEGNYGVFGSGYGEGNSAIAHYFPGAVFSNNVIAGGNSSLYSSYPGNFFPASLDAVGFVDLTNDNYKLTSTSPFKNKASDGKDVGVDLDALNAALSGNAAPPAPAPPPPATPAPTPSPTASPTPLPIPSPTPSPAPVTDKTSPSTSIIDPYSGETVSGTQPISVTASDNVGVTDGAIMVDSVIVASFSGTSATYKWNTSQTKVGGHTLQSKVQDAAGNVGLSIPVAVTVASGDVTPPSVTITYPTSGTSLRHKSTINITANASDNVVVVKTYVNGSLVCQDTSAPYSCPWTFRSRTAEIKVVALDAAGNVGTAQVTVFRR